MKLAIFSRQPALYSTRRLGLAALARGHDVQVINPLRTCLVLNGNGVKVFHGGNPIGPFDAAVSRLGPSESSHCLAILRQIERNKTYCLNRWAPSLRARDKLLTLQLLEGEGLPIVPTALARRPDDVRQVLGCLGGPPWVVKITDGSQGHGVTLVESAGAAEAVIEALLGAGRRLLIQRFIPHAADMRLFVLGSEVVAAMRRWVPTGQFRANIHQGATGESARPTERQALLALEAARILGLEMAGVDILETEDGPAVLEANASPGLEGIEAATGRNLAAAVIKFLETKAAAV